MEREIQKPAACVRHRPWRGAWLVRALALILALGGCDQLVVQLDVAATAADGHLLVEGETNLPNGTRLVVTVLPLAADPETTAALLMQHVKVQSGRFSESLAVERVLSQGMYTVRVVNHLTAAQPPDVQKVLGAGARNLRGPLVDDRWDDFEVSRSALARVH